jgi:peptidoglycan/LPS O-acetylase OafA/YrhL
MILVWLVRLAAIGFGADIQDITYWTALGRVDQFVAGSVLAWLFYRFGAPRHLGMYFPPVLVAVCAILYGFHLSGGFLAKQSWRVAWPTIEAVFWAAFVGSYLGFARYVPHVIDIVLRFLGRISYSLYFIHVIVIWIFAGKSWFFTIPSLTVNDNILLTALILVLPVVVLVSTLTYTAIEEPFLSMRRRYNAVSQESLSQKLASAPSS